MDPEALLAYLEAYGITVYGMRAYRAHEFTCSACQCPQGQRYLLALLPEDAKAFLMELPLAGKGVWRGQEAVQPHLKTLELTWAPQQCGNTPWHRWGQAHGFDLGHDEATMLREYFAEVFGVTVLFTWSQQVASYVCRACTCARGDLVHAVLDASADQEQALQEAGWLP